MKRKLLYLKHGFIITMKKNNRRMEVGYNEIYNKVKKFRYRWYGRSYNIHKWNALKLAFFKAHEKHLKSKIPPKISIEEWEERFLDFERKSFEIRTKSKSSDGFVNKKFAHLLTNPFKNE